MRRRVETEHAHVPGGGGSVALQDLDGGGLARAVRPEQGEHLAGSDVEIDALQHDAIPVLLAQVADLDRPPRYAHVAKIRLRIQVSRVYTVQDVTMPAERERWTQERRRQHTRDLLLDAAEEVFAKKGFEGASLDEIADTAGYTRGAIYKHFGGKEELFLEANIRFNERYIGTFAELVDASDSLDELDLKAVAHQWREMNHVHAERFALGTEFNLYVLRHPECRDRVAAQYRHNAELVANMIERQAERFKLKLRMPAMTVARVALAASDGIALASRFSDDDDDLYQAFVEMLLSAWEMPAS